MKYKCVDEFLIPMYDGDGGIVPNSYKCVPLDSIWKDANSSIIDGEVPLECVSGGNGLSWIEISRKSLNRYFKTMEACDEK
jgi:hypothetical protein